MESIKQKHKRWRISFRDAVFSRDKHKCVYCSVTDNLDAHHITDRHDMPNGGYVLSNGITLCTEHHKPAELFHISEGLDWFENMHPDDLYLKIKSNQDLAISDSLKLR